MFIDRAHGGGFCVPARVNEASVAFWSRVCYPVLKGCEPYERQRFRGLSGPDPQGLRADAGRPGRTAACDRQGRQPLGTGYRSAGHQHAGTTGGRTGPDALRPDALPRPAGNASAGRRTHTGRFPDHAPPSAQHRLALHPVRAALPEHPAGRLGCMLPPRCSCRSLAQTWQWRFPSGRLDAVSPDLSAAFGAGVFLPEPLASL